jgi:hypothetical protein
VWETTVDGRKLTFHLAGINNQNFIMRDDETGSWWQQVSGEAIQGPLKGKKLKAVAHDELTFATWKREQPNGRVLQPDSKVSAEYEPSDWEARYSRLRVVTRVDPSSPLPSRTLVVGIVQGDAARAYPFEQLKRQSPILDTLGRVELLLVLGDDGRSVRAFRRKVDERVLEFFVRPEVKPLEMVDSETGTTWDFQGKAIRGALAGKQLERIELLEDYWFDWKTYHPQTSVFSQGR